MSVQESDHLARYARTGDAEAFRCLVEEHQHMVFGVCKRILANAADAEDAAQNCFLELARKAGRLKAPIAGWLHHVAVQVSIDMLRRRQSRRVMDLSAEALAKAESRASDLSDRSDGSDEPTMQEIQSAVDEALARLPEKLRVPIILHYLEGRKQEDIAAQLGLTQSAVSKRLAQGVAHLQKRLKKGGAIIVSAALVSLLTASAAEAAPLTLTASLGKLSLAGTVIGAKAGATGATIGGISVLKLSIASVVAAGLVTASGIVILGTFTACPSVMKPAVAILPTPTVKALTAQDIADSVVSDLSNLKDYSATYGIHYDSKLVRDSTGGTLQWKRNGGNWKVKVTMGAPYHGEIRTDGATGYNIWDVNDTLCYAELAEGNRFVRDSFGVDMFNMERVLRDNKWSKDDETHTIDGVECYRIFATGYEVWIDKGTVQQVIRVKACDSDGKLDYQLDYTGYSYVQNVSHLPGKIAVKVYRGSPFSLLTATYDFASVVANSDLDDNIFAISAPPDKPPPRDTPQALPRSEEDFRKDCEDLRDVVSKTQDPVQGNLCWYLLKKGIAVADANAREVRPITELLGEADFVVNCIAFGKDKVWLGTNKGLFAWDRKDMFWTRFAVGGTIVDAPVKELSLGDDGKLTIIVEKTPNTLRTFEYRTVNGSWTESP